MAVGVVKPSSSDVSSTIPEPHPRGPRDLRGVYPKEKQRRRTRRGQLGQNARGRVDG